MIRRGLNKGFTVVELLLVIVIIAALAIVVVVSYNQAQSQANDSKVRDAADKFADAIKLWSAANNSAQPAGGYGSTSSATSTGCANGSTGFQDYQHVLQNSNYKCTLGDAMVATGYLSADLFNNLPGNTPLGGGLHEVFIVYPCANNANQWNLMYTLENPSATDTSTLNSTLTACGTDPSTYPPIVSYGMRAIIVIKFS